MEILSQFFVQIFTQFLLKYLLKTFETILQILNFKSLFVKKFNQNTNSKIIPNLRIKTKTKCKFQNSNFSFTFILTIYFNI